MSAFIPPTPDGGEFVPAEEIAATIKDAVVEADDRNARIAAFGDAVRDMPGQLGELFQQINDAYSEFCAAEQWGGTTVGEECRLNRVMDEAMLTLEWLRAGEQS